MKKRVLSLLLCLVMALSLIPTVAFAKGNDKPDGGQLTWAQAEEIYNNTNSFNHIDVRVAAKFTYTIITDGTTTATETKTATISNPTIKWYPAGGDVQTKSFSTSTSYEWRWQNLQVGKNDKIEVICDITVDGKTMVGKTFTFSGKAAFVQAIIDCDGHQGLDFNISGEDVKNILSDGKLTLVKNLNQTFNQEKTFTFKVTKVGETTPIDNINVTVPAGATTAQVTTDAKYAYGTYTVTETNGSIDGFNWTAPDAQNFTIDANNLNPTLTFTNNYTLATGTLTISKAFEGLPEGTTFPSVSFTVTSPNGYREDVTLPVNGQWTTTLNVPVGEYTVTENKDSAQVTDYTLTTSENELTKTATVAVEAGGSANFTNAYTKNTGTLTIIKTITGLDDLSKQLPKGITFTVSNDDSGNGPSVTIKKFTEVEGDPGKFIGSGSLVVPVGNYTVTEDTAGAEVEGYKLSTNYNYGTDNTTGEKKYFADVTTNGATVNVTNTYERNITGTELVNANLTIKKVDAVNADNLLTGAEFTLEGSNGTVIPATPDGKGTYTFSNLAEGSYTLTETKAPDGYVASTTTWTVVVAEGDFVEYKPNDDGSGFIAFYNGTVTVNVNEDVGADELVPVDLGDNNTMTVENTPECITVPITITKNVTISKGSKVPAAIPFTFNAYVGTEFVGSLQLTPTEKGDWTATGTLNARIRYSLFDEGVATVTIKEVNDGATNWTYSDKVYKVSAYQNGNYNVISDAEISLLALREDPLVFENTYTYKYTPTRRPSTPTTVTSVKTGDMGIALYAVTSLLSLSGAAVMIKKRKDEE